MFSTNVLQEFGYWNSRDKIVFRSSGVLQVAQDLLDCNSAKSVEDAGEQGDKEHDPDPKGDGLAP